MDRYETSIDYCRMSTRMNDLSRHSVHIDDNTVEPKAGPQQKSELAQSPSKFFHVMRRKKQRKSKTALGRTKTISNYDNILKSIDGICTINA